MAPPFDPSRRYTDAETAEILRLANAHPLANADPSALSLAEIEDIAASVGIAPRAVRQAARSIDRPASPRLTTRMLGGPLRMELEQSFRGTLTPERAAQALDAIRR